MFAPCSLPLLLILAAPEPSPTLLWKFKEGDVFFLRIEKTVKTTTAIEGKPTEQTSEQGGVSRFTVKKVNKDGSVTIKEDVLNVVQKMDGKDFAPLIDTLEGSTFVFTIKPDGGIEDFQGHKDYVKKLKPAQREKETVAMVEKMFKYELAERFCLFPRKALSPGDTWQRKSKLDLGPMGLNETTTQYKYEGKTKVDGRMLDRVSMTSTLEVRPNEPDSGPPPGYRLVASKITEQECKGSLLFDSATGRLHQHTISRREKGKRTITSGETKYDFDMVSVEKTTITLLKEFP